MIASGLSAFLLTVVTLATVAVAGDTSRTSERTLRNSDGSASIVVKEYQFPGAIQGYWWVSEQDLVVMAKGHLFISRNYASVGLWVSLTEDIPEFAANNSHVPGMGIVTGVTFNSMNPKKQRDLLLVQCLGPATFALSIESEPMIVGKVELETVPSSAFSSVVEGADTVFQAGMSVVFLDVQFHQTISGVAVALLRDPGCKLVDTFRCRSYAYYTAQGISDMPYVTWRLVHTTMDAMQVMFSNRQASTYNPNVAFFLSKPTMSATFLDGKMYSFDIKAVEVSRTNRIVFTEMMTSTFGEESRGGYTVIAAADAQHKIRLFVSSDNFQSTPTAANFGTHIFPSDLHPYEEELDEQETGYTLLDVQDEIFVNVYRGSFTATQQWGHTYSSGVQGQRFSLSLPYTRRLNRGDSAVDFHRVEGLFGVILANIVLNPQDESCRTCTTTTTCDESCEFGTVISRDNGKSWQRIAIDIDGEESPLNLHSYSSASTFNTHPLVTSQHAPGLILATGNIGPFLDLRSENVVDADVFMSRDAGETWTKLSTGRGIYGQTDYGGALYLFPTGRRANLVNVSIDEGATWSYFPVHSEKTYVFSSVVNSVAMPSAHYINVLAFPGEGGNDVALWIDLSGLKSRNCTGLENPTDPTSDFEYFQPSSYFSEKEGFKCLMGQAASYARKRLGASCWVDSDGSELVNFALPRDVRNCTCSRADFECDVGYIEDGESCILEPTYTPLSSSNAGDGTTVAADVESSSAHADIPVVRTPDASLCMSDQQVRIKTGYRKLGGDTCQGGVNLDPTSEPCPKSREDHAVGIIALLVLVVAGALLLIAHKARASRGFGAAVVAIFPPLKYIIGASDHDILNQYDIEGGADDDDDGEAASEEHRLTAARAQNAATRPNKAAARDTEAEEELTSPNNIAATALHADAFAVPVTVSTGAGERDGDAPHTHREVEAEVSAASRAHFVELNAMQPPPLSMGSDDNQSPSEKRNLDFIDFGQ